MEHNFKGKDVSEKASEHPLQLQAPLSWSSSRASTACSRLNNHETSASLVVRPPAGEPFAAMSTRQETCATYRGPCVASFQPALPCPSEKLQQCILHPNRNSHRKRIETMRTCTDLTCSLRKRSRTRFASAPTMAPCDRCGQPRIGRGKGRPRACKRIECVYVIQP